MHHKIRKILFFPLLALLIFIWTDTLAATDSKPFITGYHVTFIPGFDGQGNLQIAIRTYRANNVPYFLVVNPFNLTTGVLPVADFKSRNMIPGATPGYYTMASLQATPYLKALNQYTSPPYLLQNQGLTQGSYPVNGMFLTIDMCPSSKPFEADFFKTLVALADKTHKPVPIALSMSGLWMLGHEKEFDWLLDQQRNHKLAIIWTNHTLSHVYFRDLPLEKNFMLYRPEDFTQEILETEKILLQHQQIPSVFFRFPGLVADKELTLKAREFGLIPVGSNAWLAKGQKAKPGSIILVHGNSNEHMGIEDIMPLLQQLGLQLLPLTQAIVKNKE